MDFGMFFKTVTEIESGPFDYQRRLAEDPECKSRLINIPTGCGKTAAVVPAWLWNRLTLPSLKFQRPVSIHATFRDFPSRTGNDELVRIRKSAKSKVARRRVEHVNFNVHP